jgi:AcrR family transcriptional regulator
MPRAAETPRPRRLDFQTSRRRLLAAARLILAERGPEALTVSEVAHRAGLNRTTAYQHFRTRDALSSAVMAELADEMVGMFREPETMLGNIDPLVIHFVDHPEIARLALHQLLAESPLPKHGWSSYLRQFRKIAKSPKARPGVDAEMLSYLLMCIGVLWPLVARSQYESSRSARSATQRLTRELKRLLLHGALRPESWPELAQSIDTPKPVVERGRSQRLRRRDRSGASTLRPVPGGRR